MVVLDYLPNKLYTSSIQGLLYKILLRQTAEFMRLNVLLDIDTWRWLQCTYSPKHENEKQNGSQTSNYGNQEEGRNSHSTFYMISLNFQVVYLKKTNVSRSTGQTTERMSLFPKKSSLWSSMLCNWLKKLWMCLSRMTLINIQPSP